jgi:hypothetical protein
MITNDEYNSAWKRAFEKQNLETKQGCWCNECISKRLDIFLRFAKQYGIRDEKGRWIKQPEEFL